VPTKEKHVTVLFDRFHQSVVYGGAGVAAMAWTVADAGVYR
jgi:hypothetical protein